MIDLDQMEREARSRLAVALSRSVANHMGAMAGYQLPRDVLRAVILPGKVRSMSFHPIDEVTCQPICDYEPRRLEMVVKRRGPTNREIKTDWAPLNFERLGLPGLWSLWATHEGLDTMRYEFREVLP